MTPRDRSVHVQLTFLAVVFLLSTATTLAAVKVVATTTDLADIASSIGGDLVKVSSICKGNQDPHFVDAKPSYIVKLRRANLFVKVGLELEIGWAPRLLQSSRNPKIQKGAPGYVDASTGIRPLQVPTAGDRSLGDIHRLGNPHYWLDPRNGEIIAGNIADGLKRVDQEHAATYDQNLAAYTKRLDGAIAKWREKAAPIHGIPLVAYHNSWPYLEAFLGFHTVGFVEPKPGIPPSGKYIVSLVSTIKNQQARLVLMSPYYNVKTASLVARKANVPLVTLASSVGAMKGETDYFSLFDRNIETLLQTLQSEQGE